MKRKILIFLTKNLKKNQDDDYVQTWYYMPLRWKKNKGLNDEIKKHFIGYRLRKILEFLCGLLGDHELSNTEWGYGGGKYADRHCRWCDKTIRVPYESTYFEFPIARQMIRDFNSGSLDIDDN